MTRHFQDRDYRLFDYKLGTIEQLPDIELRGPVPDLSQPYFVCVGATQVFGRFCNHPFPELLSRDLGIPVLNLGLSGHGPQVFREDRFLSLINGARFAVVQLASGRIGSNSEFINTPSGRGEGERLRDGKQMNFEEFLSEEMASFSHDHVKRIVEETRDSWVGHYRDLLSAITVPKVVHWFSTVTPYRADDYSNMWKLFGPFPQLVNGRMISRIRPFCNAYVETVCRLGLPQPLWAAEREIGGTEMRNGKLFNNYYPTPEMHEAAARDLLPICRIIALGSQESQDRRAGGVIVASSAADAHILSQVGWDGVEVFTYRQLLDDKGLLPILAATGRKVVHLRRRKLLQDFMVSSSETGVTTGGANGAVEAADLASFTEAVMNAESHIVQTCRGSDLSEVFVEDAIADPEAAATQIEAHLRQPATANKKLRHALSRLPIAPSASELERLRPIFERLVLQFGMDQN